MDTNGEDTDFTDFHGRNRCHSAQTVHAGRPFNFVFYLCPFVVDLRCFGQASPCGAAYA